MSDKTFNVGIVGYGLSAKIFHIPFIDANPELKVYAVVQRTAKPDDDPAKNHPGVKVYRSTEELLDDSAVDLVVVGTTPKSHYDIAKAALKSGKHVVVEKPFTPTYSEAQDLVEVAKASGKQLAAYQNRRWDADYLTLSKILDEGLLGQVAEFETHFDRHRPVADKTTWKQVPAPGTGSVYDLGTHLIDQVLHRYGLPKRVTGFIFSHREGNNDDFDDSSTILLHYDKVLATVKAGVISPEVEQLRYWIRGTKGSFKKFRLDVQEDQLKAGKRPGDDGYGVEGADAHGVLTTAEDGGTFKQKTYPTLPPETYTAFYEKMVAAMKGNGQVPVTAQEGANVIRIVELAKQSSAEGRTIDLT